MSNKLLSMLSMFKSIHYITDNVCAYTVNNLGFQSLVFCFDFLKGIITEKLVIRDTENTKAEGHCVFCFTDDDVSRCFSLLNASTHLFRKPVK